MKPALKRFEDWPTRLDAFIASRMKSPFVWGEQDCCMFAGSAVNAMTGVDLCARFREKYSTASGAAKILWDTETHSIRVLMQFTAELWRLPEIPVSFAQRGDLVLIEQKRNGNQARMEHGMGIVSLDGTEAWAAGAEGIVTVPVLRCQLAWKI